MVNQRTHIAYIHAGLTTISSSSIVHILDLDSKSNYGSQNGEMTMMQVYEIWSSEGAGLQTDTGSYTTLKTVAEWKLHEVIGHSELKN